jgi:branched-chain amino acid transport system substrate-binding protein
VPEFIELTGDNSNGVIYNMLGGAIDSLPEAQQIKTEYEERYGRPGGYFSVVAYNEVQLYAECLNQVGDATDRLAIGECLGNLKLKTPSGNLQFDPETHLAMQGDDYYPILFYQIWDGAPYIITPDQYKAADFRMPPWMED